VLQLRGVRAGWLKGPHGISTSDFQMAADRARHHSLCGSLVPSILVVVTQGRRAPEGARSGSRSYGVALGTALRPGTGTAHAAISQAHQQVVARGRDYFKVKGGWCYLYRAIDSAGATIDYLLSAFRDADAAKRLFRKALSGRPHPQPRVINTDLAPIYISAISAIKKDGTLHRRCRHRPVQCLSNISEQDRPRRQTASERQTGIPRIPGSTTNHSGL
jgi:hypothetical protein